MEGQSNVAVHTPRPCAGPQVAPRSLSSLTS